MVLHWEMGSDDLQTRKTWASRRCWVVMVCRVVETVLGSDDLELCGKSSEICCEKMIFQNELQFAKRQPEKNFLSRMPALLSFFLKINCLEFLSEGVVRFKFF